MTWVAQRQELLQILRQKCREKGLHASLEFQEKANKKLDMERRSSPNFGNAGAVENLLKSAMCLGCSCPDGPDCPEHGHHKTPLAESVVDVSPLCQFEELYPLDFRLKASGRGGAVAKMFREWYNMCRKAKL